MFKLRDIIFRKRRRPMQYVQPVSFLSHATNSQFARKTNIKHSDLVLSAIKPFAQEVAKLEPIHYFNEQVMPTPTLRKVLTRPNDKMTFQMLMYRTMMQLKLEGNAYIYIQWDEETQVEPVVSGLFPLEPTSVEAVMDEEEEFSLRFRFGGDAEAQVIPYKNIIHLRDNFCDNDFFAANPGDALLPLLEVIDQTDGGLKRAITRVLPIKWLVKLTQAMRDEDIERHRLAYEEKIADETSQIIVTDAKAEWQQIRNDETPYLPDADIQGTFRKRIFNFFNTNEAIVNNTATEDERTAFYDAEISPIAQQLSEEFTTKVFSEREQAHGNKIVFENKQLMQFAGAKTKLNLIQFVDRGFLAKEEIREIFGLSNAPEHLEGKTFVIRREYGSVDEVVHAEEENPVEQPVEEVV